jgi:RecQ-mediated genome instability protein 1
MDRADLAGLVREGVEDAEEDEGPVPKYPRGMLRLELSDGFTTVEAVEYRSIPQLELGVTPLGYKVCVGQYHEYLIRSILRSDPSERRADSQRHHLP